MSGIPHQFAWILVCGLVFRLGLDAQNLRLDLQQFGYKPPDSPGRESMLRRSCLIQESCRIVAVGDAGDIFIGFVTRSSFSLATRQDPPLTFRLLRFSLAGAVLASTMIPTASWTDNSIFYGPSKKLLVRAGTRLILFSSNFVKIAEKTLFLENDVAEEWEIFPSPSRSAFLLYSYRNRSATIALLSWEDLTLIRSCDFYRHAQLLSVSDSRLIALRPNRSLNPLLRTGEVAEICGPSLGEFSWTGDPLKASLIDRDGIFFAGRGSILRYVQGRTVMWEQNVGRNTLVSGHVDISADDKIAGVALKTFEKENRFLDRTRELRKINFVEYEIASGTTLFEAPINPLPSMTFDFSMSKSTDSVAVVSDGLVFVWERPRPTQQIKEQ